MANPTSGIGADDKEAREVIARALFGTNTSPRPMADYILDQLHDSGWEVTRRPATYRIDPPGYPD